MKEFTIIDAADQQFGTILNNRRVTIRLRFNTHLQRWTFDLSVDDLPVLHGRRIVTGINLLRPFKFGLGILFALGDDDQQVPDRQALVNGTVRLYHVTEDEREALTDGLVS